MSKDPPNKPSTWRKVHRVLSWSAAGTDSLKTLVSAVTDSGNALMFSRTVDGGALIFTAFSGDEKFKEFITDPADIPALFAWVIENYS